MPTKKRFEQLMASIEAITTQLDSEQTDLETSLKLFRQGQALILEARARLQEIEHEFAILTTQEMDEPQS